MADAPPPAERDPEPGIADAAPGIVPLDFPDESTLQSVLRDLRACREALLALRLDASAGQDAGLAPGS